MRSPCQRGPGSLCPIATELPSSLAEFTAAVPGGSAEIRAYKLGKKRWSYNQVEVRLVDGSGARKATIQQATFVPDAPFPALCQDSAVCFNVALTNGHHLQTHLYIVYDSDSSEGGICPPRSPRASRHTPRAPAQLRHEPPSGAASSSGSADEADDAEAPMARAGSSGGSSDADRKCTWTMVTRRECCKGCQGCILRPIQRFGRLGKRQWGEGQAEPAEPQEGPGTAMKEPKFMYVSIDEACTHVDAPAFRLLAAVYDKAGQRLLASGVSPPIRVLANNDVPTGAARIPLEAQLPSDWEGWAAAEEGGSVAAPAAAQRPKRIRTRSRRVAASACAKPTSSTATPEATCTPDARAAAAAAAPDSGNRAQQPCSAEKESTSVDLNGQLECLRSVPSCSLSLSAPSWEKPALELVAATRCCSPAARGADSGACVSSLPLPGLAGASPPAPFSRWQALPTSGGTGSGSGPSSCATPSMAGQILAPAPCSFSSVTEYDCGPTTPGDAAWADAQAAALHTQQSCSPPSGGLPTNLSTSTAASAGEGFCAAPSTAEHAAAWQQHVLQRRQRLAAARHALRNGLAVQQQWGMLQRGAGVQPLTSPTDSSASAGAHFSFPSPTAEGRQWAGGMDPRSMRPAPVTTGAPAPVLAVAASAFEAGAQDRQRQLGAALPPPLPSLLPLPSLPALPSLPPLRGLGPGAGRCTDQLAWAGGTASWPVLPEDSAIPGSREATQLLEHSQAMLRAASAAAASRGGLLGALQSAHHVQQLDCPCPLGPGLDYDLIHASLRCPTPDHSGWAPADVPASGLAAFDSLTSIFDDVPSAPFGVGWA
ncbi:hypothetical protein ABPG77_010623 [Micractinium sp. CCAP 211/92]